MPRDIQIYGPTMVSVIGGGHMSGFPIGERVVSAQINFRGNSPVYQANPSELGLTSERISVTPQLQHMPIRVDSFGSVQSPEVMVNLAGAMIDMTLVDFDTTVLDICQAESLGGAKTTADNANFGNAGIMNPAGSLLGNNRKLYASGCHFVGLLLDNGFMYQSGATTNKPWWFPSCHLLGPPQEIPIGTERSLVRLRWQAVPYTPYNLSGVTPSDFTSVANALTPVLGISIPFYGASGLELNSSGSIVWKQIDYSFSGTYGVFDQNPGIRKGIYFID